MEKCTTVRASANPLQDAYRKSSLPPSSIRRFAAHRKSVGASPLLARRDCLLRVTITKQPSPSRITSRAPLFPTAALARRVRVLRSPHFLSVAVSVARPTQDDTQQRLTELMLVSSWAPRARETWGKKWGLIDGIVDNFFGERDGEMWISENETRS